MKQFNINDDIYIQITAEGWRYLQDKGGHDFIKHCIEPHLVDIRGDAWCKLQAHFVFRHLPINATNKLFYLPTIMIDDKSLHKT